MTGIQDLHTETTSTAHGAEGPGQLVRQARDAAKLSVEDLASLIKLSRVTLDAIERDDFSQLNEPVYVRGYYRKLSKVLPVGEAELMAAYERVAGHKAPPHPSKLILAGGPELGSGRRISPKLAAGIVLFGAIVGALAFWGKNRQPEPASPQVESNGPAVNAPAPTAIAVPEPSGVTESPAAPMPAATTPVDAPATAAAATPAAAAGVPPGSLQLQFDGSSWTEVKDATGRTLLSGLIDAGGSQTLDGRAPFVVFLGNAPAVKVIYRGQPVDTTPFKRGDNTARITLP